MYHRFPLKCFNEIKSYALSYMNQFNDKLIYVAPIPMPVELVDIFNKEMAEYDLPNAWNFLAFKRRNYFTETNDVHVDYTSQYDQPIHSSIVLPLENTKDTYMYWINGEYTLSKIIKNNRALYVVKWENSPTLVDRVEISNEPVIVKVDVPHSATSRKDGSYRTILSIRLQGNPEFDEVIRKRFGTTK